jgi:hypothetical protein
VASLFQIRQITLELLTIIRETENDDLTSVMQKIVCTYTEQLMPIAVEMCQHLVKYNILWELCYWKYLMSKCHFPIWPSLCYYSQALYLHQTLLCTYSFIFCVRRWKCLASSHNIFKTFNNVKIRVGIYLN